MITLWLRLWGYSLATGLAGELLPRCDRCAVVDYDVTFTTFNCCCRIIINTSEFRLYGRSNACTL